MSQLDSLLAAPRPDVRALTEQGLQKRLKTIYTTHGRIAAANLGDPPDPNNLGSGFWTKVHDENEELLILLLWLMYMSNISSMWGLGGRSILSIDAGGGTVEARGLEVARRRASFVAQLQVDTARKRMERVRRRFIDRPDVLRAEKARESMVKQAFGPGRTALTARNETTRIRFESGRDGSNDKFGPNIIKGGTAVWVWTLGPCRHCTFCPLIAGTDVGCWSDFIDGPPAHQQCCCQVEFGPPGTPTLRCPDNRRIGAAAVDSGVFEYTPVHT